METPQKPQQNQEIIELKDELKKLNYTISESSKTTEKFTLAMFVLALVQILIAVYQFIISFAYTDNLQEKIFGIVMVIITISILCYFFNRIFPFKKYER